MPHDNTWEEKSLYRKFSGKISGEEILESNFELQSNPNFKNIEYIINDFTNITGHSIEAVHTNVYANTDNFISQSKGKLKIALVVPVNSPVTDLANNYRQQMINSLFQCDIFNTVEDATKWATQK